MLKDSYRHKGLRRQLIQSLRDKGIRDERVLQAMNALPRHYFLEKAFEEKAYEDIPFPIGNEQTISQPYTVAYMTELLRVEKRQKVLEIGTGSGYQAALLSMLGARVYTIERHQDLYKRTTQLLEKLGFGHIRTYWRDGYKGLPEFAPFDRIMVTAGAPEIPEPLLDQLAPNGILVIPVGKKQQKMHRLTKDIDGTFQEEVLGPFRFVPFVSGKSKSIDPGEQ